MQERMMEEQTRDEREQLTEQFDKKMDEIDEVAKLYWARCPAIEITTTSPYDGSYTFVPYTTTTYKSTWDGNTYWGGNNSWGEDTYKVSA